jgi:hypothetical protein
MEFMTAQPAGDPAEYLAQPGFGFFGFRGIGRTVSLSCHLWVHYQPLTILTAEILNI